MFKYLSFTGQSGCYAELPLAVLAGASTFTIEFKLATTSTKSSSNNWTWGTIAGREIGDHWKDDFSFCVNNGKLCFWAEPVARNSYGGDTNGVVSSAVVNDGEVHTVAVVSSNGAIYLYCDGALVAHTADVNAKITSTATILLAKNADDYDDGASLQMDLYEARFWNVARTQEQIFADIDGTESGLQAWYLPSADGLLDYSGNDYHATLYGNPAYTETDSLDVSFAADLQRTVTNPNWSVDDYLVAHLPFDDSTTEDLCGNTWTAYGSPTIGTNGAISGSALQLDGASRLKLNGSISLGGQDFTIRGWATMNSSAQQWAGLFALNGNYLRIIRYNTLDNAFELGYQTALYRVNLSTALTSPFHFELDYQHSTGKWLLFFNGALVYTVTKSLARTTYNNVWVGANGDNSSVEGTWGGSIDEFQIYDGIALHTENFTPPTADDYDKDVVNFTADLQRKLTNDLDFAADLQRTITTPIDFTADVQRNIFHGQNFTADLQRNVSNRADFTADLQRTLSNAVDFTIDLQRRIDIPETTFAVDVQRKLTHSVDFTADLQRSLAQRNEFSVDLQRKIFRGQNFTVDLERKLRNVINVNFTADTQRQISNVIEFTCDVERRISSSNSFAVDVQRTILMSRTGTRMLSRLSPIYDDSTFMKNFFHAIGTEWEKIRQYFLTLREQKFIQTVDWGIEYLEHKYSIVPDRTLTLEERRARLGIKAFKKYPLNPAVLEKYAREYFGLDIYLDESDAGYIWLIATELSKDGYEGFLKFLRREKPAHLALALVLYSTIYVGKGDANDLPKLYTGVAQVISGNERITLPKPKNHRVELHAGAVQITSGKTTVNLSRPKSKLIKIHAGAVLVVSGTIFIGAK